MLPGARVADPLPEVTGSSRLRRSRPTCPGAPLWVRRLKRPRGTPEVVGEGRGHGRRGPAPAGIRHRPRQQAQARPRTWPARRRRSRRPARNSPHAASRHGPGSTARRRHGRPRRSRVDAIPHGRNRRRRGRRKGRKWRRRPQAETRPTTVALALLGAGTAGSCLFQPAARIAFRPSSHFIIQIVPDASLTHVKHRADGRTRAKAGQASCLPDVRAANKDRTAPPTSTPCAAASRSPWRS